MPQEKTPPSKPPATISMAEAAELLGVSEHVIRTAVEQEQIRYIRVGRLIRILRAPLLKSLDLPEDYEI